MRRCLICCLAVAVLFSAGASSLSAQAKAQNVPEIPFTSVPDFIKLPPDLYLGESMGVATNSKGHLFVFHRSGDTRLFEFDPTGKFVRELGNELYGFEFAHKVRVDAQDNVWAVDEGANMAIKFNPAGKVVMVIGYRPPVVAGAVETVGQQPPDVPYLLSRPTDIGFDPQGNIFISDGYFNHRVVKYDKHGTFVSAARYIDVDPSVALLPGLGTRHAAAASVTSQTRAVAVVVSQSSIVRVYAGGEIRAEIVPELFLLSREGLFARDAAVRQVPEAGITLAVAD